MRPLLKAGDYNQALYNSAIDIGMGFAQQAAGDHGSDQDSGSNVVVGLFIALFGGIIGMFVWCVPRLQILLLS